MSRPVLRRVLLVGFMGSGKTSAGHRVAEGLGWRFVDFDAAIEHERGASVAEIFERDGEPHFRRLEAAVADRLLQEDEVVLGSGGGWAAHGARLDALPADTACIWLRVSPREALRRASASPGARPLLDVDDPLAEARRLLEERTPFYERAAWSVDTEDSEVEDVSARILEILRAEYSRERGS